MSKISVVIITKNEAKHIRNCLGSVRWADEIIVVDSGSTDETAEIAKSMGAQVFYHKWEGYVQQREFAIQQTSSEWILVIDADEVVTSELKKEIQSRVGKEVCNGYYINRLNHFLRHQVKHCGWYPDKILRLFRKDKVKLPAVSIHEGFIVEGEIKNLHGFLLHFSYDSLQEYFEKMNRYTSLEVQDKLKRISNRSIKWYDLIFHPFSRFIRMYFVKEGYKDGVIGLTVCIVSTIYLFVLYAKMWEYQRINSTGN